MTTRKTRRAEPTTYPLTLPPPPTTKPNISEFRHRPGAPVLDRVAAELTLTNCGRPGHAIAAGDIVRLLETGEPLHVTHVDHQAGQVTVTARSDGKATTTVAGVDVEVLVLAAHPDVPDDVLESMALDEARARMAVIASDHGRYPQYRPDHFAAWVFGRVLRDIRFRDSPYGDIDFPAGQRVLVRTNDDQPRTCGEPRYFTAFSTRRMRGGCQIAVWPSAIRLES